VTAPTKTLDGHPPHLEHLYASDAQVFSHIGFHRQLGTSITKVRSVNLDKWTPDMLDLYQHIDNMQANSYWENKLPAGFERPNESTSNSLMWAFVNNKYVKKRYAPKDQNDPANEYIQKRNGVSTSGSDEESRNIPLEKQAVEAISSAEQPSLPFNELLIGDIHEVKLEQKKDVLLLIGEPEIKISAPKSMNLGKLKEIYNDNNGVKEIKAKKQPTPVAKAIQMESYKMPIPSNECLGIFDVNDFLSSMPNHPAKQAVKMNTTKCFDDLPTNW